MRPTYCVECNGHLDPVLPDCPECGAHVPQSDSHHDSDITFEDTDPNLGHRTVKRRWRIHVPWGLFAILILYAGGSMGFLHYREVNSPTFQALQKVHAAMAILGSDRGDTAPAPKLDDAYANLLDAAALRPDDRSIHEEVEEVEKIMARRGRRPDVELKRKAGMLASQYAQIVEGRSGMFMSGARSRWDLDGLVDSSADFTRYVLLGGLVIVLLWAYREFQDYLHAHKQDDEKHLNRREELSSLHAHRKR